MRHRLLGLLGLLVVVCIASAQDGAYSPSGFESFITKELKKEFKKQQKADDFLYDITGSFHAELLVKRKELVFYEQYVYELPSNAKQVMAAKLEKWNAKATLSKAMDVTEAKRDRSALRSVRFQGTMSVAKISGAKLKEYHDKLDLEFEDFVIYMQDLLKYDKKKPAPKQ